MSVERLLPLTCYICLEECSTTSPCECNAPVHHKCLWYYNKKSGAVKCTICQEEFHQLRTAKCLFGTMVGVVGLFLVSALYILCGFVGESVWHGLGICDCKDFSDTFSNTIVTQSFVASSLSLIFIIGLCVGCGVSK